MIKSKPFFIAALVFGGLGLIVLILTVISFFCGDNLISAAVGGLMNMDTDSFNDATMGQIAVVFFIPTFIFAFRCFADNDDEPDNDVETVTAIDNAVVIESAADLSYTAAEPDTDVVRHAVSLAKTEETDSTAANSADTADETAKEESSED